MGAFIITVDTEGDNLWAYRQGDMITTHNARYIPKFQQQCESFGFKPVYLVNYEMLCDEEFVTYVRDKQLQGLCEVGLHLHAWNTPPIYALEAKYGSNPYLLEYPQKIMYEKFDVLYKLFCQKIGCKPISHRAGRWAMNGVYFELLQSYGIAVDCSVTPGIDWSCVKGANMGGSDYSKSPKSAHYVGSVLEVPHTVKKSHKPLCGSLRHKLKTLLCGENLQLRPAVFSFEQMAEVVNMAQKGNDDYIEFMIHSSELMPGASPYAIDQNGVDKITEKIESIFAYVKSKGYVGKTLAEYYNSKRG